MFVKKKLKKLLKNQTERLLGFSVLVINGSPTVLLDVLHFPSGIYIMPF